jgi:hypothetical protein
MIAAERRMLLEGSPGEGRLPNCMMSQRSPCGDGRRDSSPGERVEKTLKARRVVDLNDKERAALAYTKEDDSDATSTMSSRSTRDSELGMRACCRLRSNQDAAFSGDFVSKLQAHASECMRWDDCDARFR